MLKDLKGFVYFAEERIERLHQKKALVDFCLMRLKTFKQKDSFCAKAGHMETKNYKRIDKVVMNHSKCTLKSNKGEETKERKRKIKTENCEAILQLVKEQKKKN